ncbi:MAG: tetratricopeptide repeat protein [Limnohabitans sp.]
MKSLLIALVFCAVSAFAADTPTSVPDSSSSQLLAQARAAIKAGQFEKAVDLLKQAEQKQSADWNNLMGYSLRKKSPPDLVNAEIFYKAALALEPAHRGALEYYGELLLMKNDLTGAEALLARLDKACRFGCEEYRDLKASVQAYKSKK